MPAFIRRRWSQAVGRCRPAMPYSLSSVFLCTGNQPFDVRLEIRAATFLPTYPQYVGSNYPSGLWRVEKARI